jgi:hypothetical protein
MSIQLPYLSTIGGGVEAVHIIPLEEEIDRAVRAFEVPGGFKANRVYLLAWVPDVLLRESDRNLRFCHHVVRERLEAIGIETVTVLTNIFDLLDVIKKVSSIVKIEKMRGNAVYVNMSHVRRGALRLGGHRDLDDGPGRQALLRQVPEVQRDSGREEGSRKRDRGQSPGPLPGELQHPPPGGEGDEAAR